MTVKIEILDKYAYKWQKTKPIYYVILEENGTKSILYNETSNEDSEYCNYLLCNIIGHELTISICYNHLKPWLARTEFYCFFNKNDALLAKRILIRNNNKKYNIFPVVAHQVSKQAVYKIQNFKLPLVVVRGIQLIL